MPEASTCLHTYPWSTLPCSQDGVAPTPDPGALDRLGIQRMLFDVFHEDITLFRDYCAQVGMEGGCNAGCVACQASIHTLFIPTQDPTRYGRLVSFLDDDGGAGWDLLSCLVRHEEQGGKSALELMRHRFLMDESSVDSGEGKRGSGGSVFRLPWS